MFGRSLPLQGDALKKKALFALKQARAVLKTKLKAGALIRSEEEKQEGQEKLQDIEIILSKLQALDADDPVLQTPQTFLKWKPFDGPLQTVEYRLNRQRLSKKNPDLTTTLKILLKALGVKNYRVPTFPILQLPSDPLAHVFRFLPDEDLASLAQANQESRERTKPALAYRKFFHHVAYAKEPELINAMILDNPKLLLAYGTPLDPKGRVIPRRTALQIAMTGLDTETTNTIWDLFMHSVVINANRGIDKETGRKETDDQVRAKLDAERTRQLQEQFPEPPSFEPTDDFKEIIAPQFVDALTNAPLDEVNRLLELNGDISQLPPSDLTRAIQAFWDYVPEDRFPDKGFLFPCGDYIHAEDMNLANFDAWGGSDQPRTNLAARLFIGRFDRTVPAHLAQLKCHGFSDVVLNRESPKRSLKFRYHDGSYYDLCSSVFKGFGFEYYCEEVRGRAFTRAAQRSLGVLVTHGSWSARWHSVASYFFQQTLERLLSYNRASSQDHEPPDSVKPN